MAIAFRVGIEVRNVVTTRSGGKELQMRKILTLSVLTAAIVAAGCTKSSISDEGMTADLERDLALATAARPRSLRMAP